MNAEPIPGYRLLERLGRGGFGEVWKAEAPGGMHKAIKFVFGDMEGVGEEGKAAEQEYKSLNRVKTIRHPFILSLERFEVINGQLVIVMELADCSLWDRFQECVASGKSGIPRAELIAYLEEAAEALDLMNLHHQIQHLDIKPQNLFLVHRHIKVADFGLAKDLEGTMANLTGGITPVYAPPETFEGWVSRQSDQYSLAIVYQELLTGKRPFNGTNTRQLIMQHMSAVPDVSALPPADRTVVFRALSKAPADRFATCADFVTALKAEVLPAGPSVALPPSVDGGSRFGVTGDTPGYSSFATERTVRSRPAGLPALTTRSSKGGHTGPLSPHRRPVTEPGAARPAQRERVGEGVLSPALIVGVGGTGWGILRALRRLIQDQFDRPTLPHLRWLYVDTDPAAAESATTDPNVALVGDEVLHMPLRRPGHYLTRDGLPSVEAWLPQEDLFRIPRTPATEGVRGIGRLALCDHYHVLCHRIRIGLEPFLKADGLAEADRLTHLGIRSNFPRVYVATSLSGGTGSGMFLDLTYLIRREVRRFGFGSPRVVGMLGVPGFSSRSGDGRALANARAALTELNHYGRPGAGYEALFDTREPAVQDPERPFRRCTLLPLPARYDKDDYYRAANKAAHVAYADLLTTVGREANPDTAEAAANPLTLVGVQRLSWPRAQTVRTAGWLLARKTLQAWTSKSEGAPGLVPSTAIDAVWAERRLERAALLGAVESHLKKAVNPPVEQRIEEVARGIAAGEYNSQTGFLRLFDLLGRPRTDESNNPCEVGKALATRVKELTVHADNKLLAVVLSMAEQPGLRLPGAEEAIQLLRCRLDDELAQADQEAAVIEEQARAAFVPIHYHFSGPAPGTQTTVPKWNEADMAKHLRHWAVARLHGMIARACASVYGELLGNLPEYVREVNVTRTILTELMKQLEATPPRVGLSEGVCRPVFPDGSGSVGEAASRLVKSLRPEQLREFENALQARIRHECRGLAAVCARAKDLGTFFLTLMTDQATRFVDAQAPHIPSSQALSLQAQDPTARAAQVAEFVAAAAPPGLGLERSAPPTVTVLGLPEDAASEGVRQLVAELCQGTDLRVTTSPDDIILLQEARDVSLSSLPHLTAELGTAYSANERRPATSHARTDISWAPVGTE
jgi:hypothetical protein